MALERGAHVAVPRPRAREIGIQLLHRLGDGANRGGRAILRLALLGLLPFELGDPAPDLPLLLLGHHRGLARLAVPRLGRERFRLGRR